MKRLIVEIENPPMTVEFSQNLRLATVRYNGAIYEDLEVKKSWMGESDYLYQIIVPIAPLPAKRYMLALGRDAIFHFNHPEREPFPELHDSEPMEIPKGKKRKNQMSLWSDET